VTTPRHVAEHTRCDLARNLHQQRLRNVLDGVELHRVANRESPEDLQVFAEIVDF
jgi:hypothetical protein